MVTGRRAVIPGRTVLGGICRRDRAPRCGAVGPRGRSAFEIIFRHDPAQHPLGFGHIKTAIRILAEEPLDYRPQRACVKWRSQFVGDDGGQAGQRTIPLERRVALDRRVKRGSQRP
jgi:hypothetical protein